MGVLADLRLVFGTVRYYRGTTDSTDSVLFGTTGVGTVLKRFLNFQYSFNTSTFRYYWYWYWKNPFAEHYLRFCRQVKVCFNTGKYQRPKKLNSKLIQSSEQRPTCA